MNVGGGTKAIPIPQHYNGWEHVLLDIDPAGKPDIICDARELSKLSAGVYDAIYCSHNLEHYWRHDLPKVLLGFAHVLKQDGFVEIDVPDLKSVFEKMVAHHMDLDDALYESPSGPITIKDIIFGYGKQIAASGQDFYAHKNGFTAKSLARSLFLYGFKQIYLHVSGYAIHAMAFRAEPTPEQQSLLQIKVKSK